MVTSVQILLGEELAVHELLGLEELVQLDDGSVAPVQVLLGGVTSFHPLLFRYTVSDGVVSSYTEIYSLGIFILSESVGVVLSETSM